MGPLRLLAAALATASLCALGTGVASAAVRSHRRTHRCGRSASFHGAHTPASRRRRARTCARAHRRTGSALRHHAARRDRPTSRVTVACADAGLAPSRWNVPAIRAAVLCLVNRERAARGEHPLQANGQLEQAAQRHSESMALDGYFEHVGPGGDTPLDRMRAAGYIYSSRIDYEVGENIAWGSGSLATPRAIVAAWMASPEHRANILDPRYRDSAIGVAAHLPSPLGHGHRGGLYTQDFGVRVG